MPTGVPLLLMYRDGCWMWPCYGVYHCACARHFLFVYFVSECNYCAFMHWDIPTSTIYRFLILWRLVSVLFLINFFQFVMQYCPHTSGWCVIFARVHQQMASNSQYTLHAPSVFPQESTGSKSQLHSKQSSNGPSPEHFMILGGYFECYMYHIMALGWLKKQEAEERKKEEDEQFWLSTVSGLPLWNSYYTMLLLVQTGASSINCFTWLKTALKKEQKQVSIKRFRF